MIFLLKLIAWTLISLGVLAVVAGTSGAALLLAVPIGLALLFRRRGPNTRTNATSSAHAEANPVINVTIEMPKSKDQP